jgi:hypothetical protein
MAFYTHSPSPDLLLLCLRNDSPDVKIQNLQALQEEDWQNILQESLRYKTTPLLHHTLKPLLPVLNVPADIKKQMQETYYRAAVRNMKVYQQLSRLASEFNKNNIAVILLKGAHLAEFVYGNLALRPMGDIDLLAKKEDLLKVSRLLMDQGYASQIEDVGSSEHHLAPFIKKNRLRIEVHFNIYKPPFSERFVLEDLWTRSQTHLLHGIEMRTLSPEDLLLHLCVHTALVHGFNNGIMPFIDIFRTVEHYKPNLDWNGLVDKSRQMGLNKCLYLMLTLTDKLMGLAVPKNLWLEIKPADDEDKLRLAEELLSGKSTPITPGIAKLFSDEKWSHKLNHLKRRAFPTGESMIYEKPGDGHLLSHHSVYLSRIRSITKRHGKYVFRVLLRDKEITAAVAYENRRNTMREWLMS